MKLDIVFAGVGGQGIVVASDIFCEAAMMDGWDVAKAEVHGMAQRGGSIVAHVRIGDNVQILSGDIIKGNVRIGNNCSIESSVNMTGSDEFPLKIGNNVTIKGTSYIFGSVVENNIFIEIYIQC